MWRVIVIVIVCFIASQAIAAENDLRIDPDLRRLFPLRPDPTVDRPAAAGKEEWKVVDGDDLAVAPRKYIDKNIEVRNLACFYADKDEFRCISMASHKMLAIFAVKLEDDGAQTRIENDCDAIKVALASPRCRVTLRFSVAGNKAIHEDIMSGYQKRTVILTQTATVVSAPPPAQRRH